MGPLFLPSDKLSVPGEGLGSKRFVEEVFEQNRDRFGKTRKDGARKPKGGSGWGELSVLRDLRLEVFG